MYNHVYIHVLCKMDRRISSNTSLSALADVYTCTVPEGAYIIIIAPEGMVDIYCQRTMMRCFD